VFCNFTLFCTGLLLGDHPATQKCPVKHDILTVTIHSIYANQRMNDKYKREFLEQQTGVWLTEKSEHTTLYNLGYRKYHLINCKQITQNHNSACCVSEGRRNKD